MINLYSDTQTLPTDEMKQAMASADLGDDVQGLDPTVNRLEAVAAERLGKEAALLVTSGTQGNLVSLMAHGGHGDELFIDPDAHAYYYETGALCSIAGYVPRFVASDRGQMRPDALRASIRAENVHFPAPRLLWLENTHNRGGGSILGPERQRELVAIARGHGLQVHLDGARIFNAAIALGIPAARLCEDVDSVQFCLSKSLSCPVGSVVVGSREFILRARRARKRLGGGMRQAGIIAACGIVALESMIDRLADDHANARALAEGLTKVPGVSVNLAEVETNMIYADISGWGVPSSRAVALLKDEGVLVSDRPPNHVRVVTHRHFSEAQVPAVLEAFRRARGKAS